MIIRTLRNKIVVSLILVVIFLGILVGFWMTTAIKNFLTNQKKEEIIRDTIKLAHNMSDFLALKQRFAEELSHNKVLVGKISQGEDIVNDAELLDFFDGIRISSDFEDILYLDMNGNVLFSTNEKYQNNNFGYRKYFTDSLKDGSYMGVVINAIIKQPDFIFAHSVKTETGELNGVVAIILNTEAAKEVLMADVNGNTFSASQHMLVDENGIVVLSCEEEDNYKSLGKLSEQQLGMINADNRYDNIKIEPLPYDNMLATMNKDEGVSVLDFYDNEDKTKEMVSISSVQNFPFHVVTEFQEQSFLAAIYKIYLSLGLNILLVCVGTALGAYLLLTKFLRPLKQLNNAAQKISNNDFDFAISIKSGDELEDLGGAFNVMVDKIKKTLLEVDAKVKIQTEDMRKNQVELENQRKAALNILEDIEEEKLRSEKLASDLEKDAKALKEANKLIESQKEQAEGILRYLRSISDGVVATDLAGKILFFNEAAENLSGVSSLEAIGKSTIEIMKFFEEEKVDIQYEIIPKIVRGEVDLVKKTHDLLLKNNKTKVMAPVSLSLSPIIDSNKQEKSGYIMIIHDVTQERGLEKAKDNFLSVAAHQLRTPLSGIRWNLEMLLEGDVGRLPKEAAEVVKNINENNQRLIVLVNDLLNVSRINSGKMMEIPDAVNVCRTISEVLKSTGGMQSEHGIKVKFGENKCEDMYVFIGPKRFFEIITNIISNALKYTPNGGNVEISIAKKLKTIKITVTDSGIGIPENQQKNIFSRFFRAENAIVVDPSGSGLGLSVIKSFIEEAGGSVSFKSVENKGTSFFIILPILDKSK